MISVDKEKFMKILDLRMFIPFSTLFLLILLDNIINDLFVFLFNTNLL